MSKGWDLAHLGDAVARVQELRAGLAEAEQGLAQRILAFGPAAGKARELVAALLGDEPVLGSEVLEPVPAGGIEVDPAAIILTRAVPWNDGEAAPLEVVQVLPAETPAPAAVVDQPAPAATEVVQPDPDEVAAPIDGPDEPLPPAGIDQPAPAADAAPDEEGWMSCKRYAALCGVSEPAIYVAISRGVIGGEAVHHGPPKRVHAALADRQILERGTAGHLRAMVARRVETPVTVLESLPAETGMTELAAVRLLRGFGSTVLELGGAEYTVDGVQLAASDVIEKAASIQARNQRLAAARHAGRGGVSAPCPGP